MSDYRGRMFDEYEGLKQRIDKLKAFILGDVYDTLSEVDKKDLKEQLKHMEAYFSVLGRRVSRQCSDG